MLFTAQLIVKNLFSRNLNFNVSIHYTQKKKSSQSKMTKVEYIFLHWDHRVNNNFLKIDYFRPFHTNFPFTIEFFQTNFNTYTNKTQDLSHFLQSLKNIAWINNLSFRFDLLWRLEGALKLHFIYYARLVIILSSIGVYSLHFPPILSENWVTVFLCFLSFLSALCLEFRFDSLCSHIMKG